MTNAKTTFKYNPKLFYSDEDNGYLENLFVKAYEAVDNDEWVDFEIYRSKILTELKILWKNGVMSKSYADEIAEYLWRLM